MLLTILCREVLTGLDYLLLSMIGGMDQSRNQMDLQINLNLIIKFTKFIIIKFIIY